MEKRLIHLFLIGCAAATAGTGLAESVDTIVDSSSNNFSYYSVQNRGVVLNDQFYFTAHDSAHGRELWVSDGTASGTRVLVDLLSGPDSSEISGPVVHNDRVFFRVNPSGGSLWSTDGDVDSPDLIDWPGSFVVNSGLQTFGDQLVFLTNTELVMTSGVADDAVTFGLDQLFDFGQLELRGSCKAVNESFILFDLIADGSTRTGVVFDGQSAVVLDDFGDSGHFDQLIGELDNQCYFRTLAGLARYDHANRQVNTLDLNLNGGLITRWLSGNGLGLFSLGSAEPSNQNGLYRIDNNSLKPTLLRAGDEITAMFIADGQLYLTSGDILQQLDLSTELATDLLKGFSAGGTDYFRFEDQIYFSGQKGLYRTDGTPEGTKTLFADVFFSDQPGDGWRIAGHMIDADSGRFKVFLEGTPFQRGPSLVMLTNQPSLRPSVSGNWVHPGLRDQGLMLFHNEDATGRKTLFAAWFLYLDGEQLWLAGNADYQNGQTTISMPLIRTSGLGLLDFDTDATAQREQAGELTLKLNGCSLLDVTYDLEVLGAGQYEASPLLQPIVERFCVD